MDKIYIMQCVGPTPGASRRRPAHPRPLTDPPATGTVPREGDRMPASPSATRKRVAPPPPTSLGAATLPAQIHDALEEAIIEGVFAPGARLHADKLAAEYGVSRIPIREALRSLHAAGWVDIRPRYGVYVRDRSLTELHQLVESRSLVESALTGWAATRRGEADVAALRDVVTRSRSAADAGDRSALLALSGEFATAVRVASGNTVLSAISAGLEKRARFYFSMVAADLGPDWVTVHAQLTELIARGAGESATATARQHILDTGRAIADLLAAHR